MPISPENRALYPADWPAISRAVKEAAGWCCEGSPAYPDCRAAHGEPHPVTGSKVVLTTAHVDHDPTNCEPGNLRSQCQRCHLTYDAAHHARNAAATRRARLAVGDLFEVPPSIAPLPAAARAISLHFHPSIPTAASGGFHPESKEL